MKGIFKKLLELNIIYSVVVNLQKSKFNDNCSRDYFLVLKPKDETIYKKYLIQLKKDKMFKKYNDDMRFVSYNRDFDVCEMELKKHDVSMFRQLSSEYFKKVVHTTDGRVYEIKGLSFKES